MNDKGRDDLGACFVDSILSPEVIEQAVSLPDAIFSHLTSDTVLDNIPVFGSVWKITKGCLAFGDYIYLRKIAYFLAGSRKQDFRERTQFQQQLTIDHKLRAKVGEQLLLLLDSIDNYEKATMLAKIFGARLREDIDENIFFKLATAIKNASIADLRALERSYKKIATYDSKAGKPFSDTLDNATAQSLFNVGLVRTDGATETLYLHNELGSQLVTLLKSE